MPTDKEELNGWSLDMATDFNGPMKDMVSRRRSAGLRQIDIAGYLNMHRARLAIFETAVEIYPTPQFYKDFVEAIDHLAEGNKK